MSKHRVCRLKLRVRAAKPSANLAGSAEAFARAVLDRCGEKLEARAPGRRYFVRRLPLCWSIEVARLDEAAEIDRLASELAEDLAAAAVEPALEPVEADVVAFADDAHFFAAYWHACVQSRQVWYFAALGSLEEELGALTSPERAPMLPEVLARLWRHGALIAAIAAAPNSALPALELAAAAADQTGHPNMPSLRLAVALELGARAADVLPRFALQPAQHTAFGGLFFLLNPLLELKAGELLYAACLPEGLLLRHALACLLGDSASGDPALELCTGVAAGAELPQIAASQHAEVGTALLSELVTALPRRGLADLPVIALHSWGSERLLVAHAVGSPFVIFAWPAVSRQDAATGLREFLDRWPRSAPRPVAAPALCELDLSARLRPTLDPPGALALPPAPDGPTAALLCQLVGAGAHLFAARAGGPTSLSDFAAAQLAAEADVIDDGDDRVVTLAAESIRLGQRRAGLDRDPGWVPWLARQLRFRFLHPEDEVR